MIENNQRESIPVPNAEQRLQDMHFDVLVLRDMHVERGTEQQMQRAELEALRVVAWACLASSPEAQALLTRERGGLDQYFRTRGLNDIQAEGAREVLDVILQSAQMQPRSSLPGLVHGLVFDVLTAAEAACKPSRWTARGVWAFAGVAAGAFLLTIL